MMYENIAPKLQLSPQEEDYFEFDHLEVDGMCCLTHSGRSRMRMP